MNALLLQFISESRDALETIARTLLALEHQQDDSALIDELFRVVHTLKGNSGLFTFPELTAVLHASEDAMEAVRAGELNFSPALADDLLKSADYISSFLDAIEQAGRADKALLSAAVPLVAQLRAWLKPCEPNQQVRVSEALTTEPKLRLDGPAQAALEQAHEQGQSLYWVEYTPAADCFFQGTDPLHIVRQLQGVVWRKFTTVEPWPALNELDAYACNLKVELLAATSLEQLETLFCYCLEQVQWQLLEPAPAPAPAPAPMPAPAAQPLSPLALDILRAQRHLLAQQSQGALTHQQAALKTVENVLVSLARQDDLRTFADYVTNAQAGEGYAPLLDWLASLSTAIAVQDASVDAYVKPDKPAATESLVRKDESNKPLKVEPAKIDRLMNLIGEIVVAKNGLPYLAARAENEYGQRELAREIKMQYGVINRIAEDLQDAIMQVRMMPVSFVLQRFPRLVRDISRKLGKQVNLILEGEETEADKAMIEALADPLVHVVRNALDHGLELPAQRLALGKPETGTLRISASHNADQVVLTISDDGRGIDPQAIKAKVLEKGLKSLDELAPLSDQELIELVFLPGFSTAQTISDLSGRGVGMDVVRDAIAKVGGHCQLTSQLGIGTELKLWLPLSMAVTQVMIIESAGQRYGIAMDQVMETVRLPKSEIYSVKQQSMTLLRGRALPLLGLNALLALDRPQELNEDDEHAVMVLRLQGEPVGLVIDDFHGSVEIILKPMSGIIGDLAGYAGTAVMGDGSILMILNPAELMS